MKFLKTLGLAAATAAVLTALIGSGTASATALTSPEGTVLKTGSSIHAVNSGASTLTTEFKNIECKESTIQGKTTAESGTTIPANVETLTFGSCNCEVKVLKGGTLSVQWTSGSNGTVRSSGTEVTTSCSTIFGTVHCVYATSSTALGTLTGGNPAKVDISSADVPRLTTSALCDESANWDATYEITSPKPLYVDSSASGATPTSLSTSLSGEAKSGEEITINEGSKAKDTATLSGTNAGKATGKVKFRVYKDKECKELAAEAGEGSLSEGKASSEEIELEAGVVYYWQAEYPGDSNNLKSTSTCGEVLTVKAKTSLSTTLSAEEEEPIEGAEITVYEGIPVKDTATLSGTRSSSATGEVQYNVYADNECEELVAGAGKAGVEAGVVDPSSEVELEEGTYYWQAEYLGDALHQESKSTCGVEVLVVVVGLFKSNANPATVVGKQLEKQVFEFAGNKVECTKGLYAALYQGGPLNLGTLTLTVDPIYSECTGLGAGFPTQEVKPEGCKWELTARHAKQGGGFKDKTTLACPAGHDLKVLAFNNMGVVQCEARVTGGQEATFFEFENILNVAQRLLRVTPKLENLFYTVTKQEAGCQLPAVGPYGLGKLTGKFKLEVEGANLFIQ
jgi:hypothetical protein